MVFPSVYEMFVEDLTTVRKQHFWDYCSGAIPHSRWTLEQLVGGDSTLAMSDSVDGGMIFTNQSTSNRVSSIHFNNKRPFSPTSGTFIWVAQRSSATSLGVYLQIGLGGTNGQDDTNSVSFLQYDAGSSYIQAYSKNGSSETSTNTTVATNSDMNILKCQIKSSSSADYSINGVLQSTSGNNSTIPVAKMQPKIRMDNVTDTGVRTVNIKYVECYNS